MGQGSVFSELQLKYDFSDLSGSKMSRMTDTL